MGRKKVGIIGAGPGGLSCAMLLASKGIDVTVFEKDGEVGGRNAPIKIKGFTFDTGPTFLMMRFILDDIFRLSGRNVTDYLEFVRIEPMYHLNFDDLKFSPTTDREKMRLELSEKFPGNEDGLKNFYIREKERYRKLAPCLQIDYSNFSEFFAKHFIEAIPYLLTRKPLFGNLGNYFKQEKLRLCFTFQSKYLGMSPWECPGAFTMIPYVEHEYGIYHVIGGLNQIPKAMAKVVEEHGGRILKNAKVRRLILDGKKVKGLELEDGSSHMFDDVVINSDFAYSMENLVDPKKITKYSKQNLKKKKYSCSTFMLYLGLDKKYDFPHHNIYFAKDYRSNIKDIFIGKKLSEDMSFYIQNASASDSTLAPEGKSTIYVLVPVPNNSGNLDWNSLKLKYQDKVISEIEKRTPLKDLRKHIEVMKITTPIDWEQNYNVYIGATFNLAHNLSQMLYFRPHNKFEELENCFLVGGGTHPGSGLPTIYESGRISADLILKKYGIARILPSAIPLK